VGEELGLGLHAFPDRLEAGATELVEDQSGVVLAIFEHQGAERLGHRQLSLFEDAAEFEIEVLGDERPVLNRSGTSISSLGYGEPAR